MHTQQKILLPLPMYVYSAGVDSAPPAQQLSPRYVPLPGTRSHKASDSTSTPSSPDAPPADEARAYLVDGSWAAFQGPESLQACYAIADFLELPSPAPDETAASFGDVGVPEELAVQGSAGTVPSVGQCVRWWAQGKSQRLCPLTGFPIGQLPYPPFKMQIGHGSAATRVLVDGKALALQLVAEGHAAVNGHTLEAPDIAALDDYLRQCKLGPFRPNKAQSLARAVARAGSAAERARARAELERFRGAAREALRRLRRIQQSRIASGGAGQARAASRGGAAAGTAGRAAAA
ncbi:unnamed protein product [Prorocentrum cordatum]|uniref:Uncharacterized protein n=1 Tax=Prorocentrum cordatum TaxID=2364126 RepID=A0ABN9RCZ3_9DINO|nr:unnamed protein product [Polarella glacialis]